VFGGIPPWRLAVGAEATTDGSRLGRTTLQFITERTAPVSRSICQEIAGQVVEGSIPRVEQC
jgi:hypothetical protein